MVVANAILATVDLHAKPFAPTSAHIRATASKVLASALLDTSVLIAQARVAAVDMERAITLENVSAILVGEVETAPLC